MIFPMVMKDQNIENKEVNDNSTDEKVDQSTENKEVNDNSKIERIDELKKKIMILEWDLKKNQLNPGKQIYLENLKKELNELNNELNK